MTYLNTSVCDIHIYKNTSSYIFFYFVLNIEKKNNNNKTWWNIVWKYQQRADLKSEIVYRHKRERTKFSSGGIKVTLFYFFCIKFNFIIIFCLKGSEKGHYIEHDLGHQLLDPSAAPIHSCLDRTLTIWRWF